MFHTSGARAPKAVRAGSYLDRACDPAETVERVRRHFPALGITRVARQTGLDRVGIACYAAFRPNALTLASSQGKGLSEDAARASAVMEAVEFSVAEAPRLETTLRSADDIAESGAAYFDPWRLLPFGQVFDRSAVIRWARGRCLLRDRPVFAPLAAIAMGARNVDLPGICQCTNGLASGNTESEAVFHALCELIERDATTLWSLRSEEAIWATCFDPLDHADEAIDRLVEQIRGAGLRVALFDQTSDLGIPTVMAIIGESDIWKPAHLDLAAGYGTHPVAARATIRALTEAAQTRITSIAGSRDDILPGQFRAAVEPENWSMLQTRPSCGAPRGMPLGTTLSDLHHDLIGRLLSAGLSELACVRLDRGEYGIAVVKVLSSWLEDREPNLNWRPGPRALSVLMGGA